MSRKCPECGEAGRAHLLTCSYAPNCADREEFIRKHAVALVRQLEEQVRRQAKELTTFNHRVQCLTRANEKLREMVADNGGLFP